MSDQEMNDLARPSKEQVIYANILVMGVWAGLGVARFALVITKIDGGCLGPPAVDIWAANEYAAHAD
ncbi:MAG: hypothetical protein GY809_32110, partial [Planctomycetes bacterium]|nr:hypothetical protein [Planctomycetota bacterium]